MDLEDFEKQDFVQRPNVVGWFELPVKDMERAIKFYETVFDFSLERYQVGSLDIACFPMNLGGSGAMGSLVYNPEYVPSSTGVLIYFTAYSGDLRNELGRVEAAGGKILIPRRKVSENHGFMAVILDSEGNRIAISSKE